MGKARARALALAAIGGFAVTTCVLGVRPYRSMRGRFRRGKRGKGLWMAIQKLVGATETPDAAYADVAVEFYRGEVQYHKAGKARALQLRRRGRVNGAANDRHLEYKHFVRDAEKLTNVVGVDGGTGFGWIDNRRKRLWIRASNSKLAATRTGVHADSPLPVGKALLYMVTRGPRKGAAYELYIYHKSNLQHSRKMLKYARLLQRNKLENQARELLCKERDRCISLAFPPEAPYRPM